ncbi:MAG: hypothetical protein AB1393_02220 [Candidatus Edwardsbacteria bacterium]
MSPNEIKILKIVEGRDKSRDKISSRKMAHLMGISTEYASYLMECLAKNGYLAQPTRGFYSLSPKGADALLSQLYHLESRIRSDISRLPLEAGRLRKEIKRLTLRKEQLLAARPI